MEQIEPFTQFRHNTCKSLRLCPLLIYLTVIALANRVAEAATRAAEAVTDIAVFVSELTFIGR